MSWFALLHLQLGDVAEWIASVGTVAAFGATWYVIHNDHKLRRDEQADKQWKQAHKMTMLPLEGVQIAGTSGYGIYVRVNNNGKRSVSDVDMTIFTRDGNTILEQRHVDAIAANLYVEWTFPIDHDLADWWDQGRVTAVVNVTFTDVYEQRWSKDRFSSPIKVTTP